MHAAQINSWKPRYSREAMAWSPSQKHGGMAHMTGGLKWVARPSEGTGEVGEVGVWLYILQKLSTSWNLKLMMIR